MARKEPNPRDRSFNFEARKAGLSQTKNGYYLRLELDPQDLPPELAEASMGQRWMVALVPMPDDLPEPTRREQDEGDRAIQIAGILCKDSDFQKWIGSAHLVVTQGLSAEEAAASTLRKKLGIASRRELKTNTRARKELYAIQAKFFEEGPDTEIGF